MQSQTPAAAPISHLVLLLAVAAGAPAGSQQPAQPAQPVQPSDQVAAELRGLPTFLLPVPAGRVTMGMTTEQLLQAVYEAVNPRRPELAARDAAAVRKPLVNTLSELGQQCSTPVLLGKWPVTNVEFEAFIGKMKKLGHKEKPPFHWWR
jgi:formylglycine-generating enzyme required for sulfatase activity